MSILSALEDAGIDVSQYDDYININLFVYGKNYNDINILREIGALFKENKIKAIDKRKIVNDYQEKHWIEKHKENL